jgi:hypothetical protein
LSEAEKRQRLFDLYTRHVTLYEPDKQGIFYCPLCLRAFTQEALNGPNPYLSLAHIVSESLGGTTSTLSCTECNNNSGSRLEGNLVKRLLLEDRVLGQLRIPKARFTGPFGNIGVEFEFSPDGRSWSIFAIPKQTNPADLERVEKCFNDLVAGRTGNVSFSLGFREKLDGLGARLAIYQTAYLLMFRYFGYEYILDPNVAVVREQLMNPTADTWNTQIAVVSNLSDTVWKSGKTCAVMFLREPRAVLVLLRLQPKSGQARTLGVVMPGFERPYDLLVPIGDFNGKVIPYAPDALLDTKWYGHQLWRWVQGVGIHELGEAGQGIGS